jgi:hypothetical protein
MIVFEDSFKVHATAKYFPEFENYSFIAPKPSVSNL